ncbi:TetR/AcrR family transcriptional regulator [Nocardiopsis sp. LOL_012]|uniref:TetR/AcrR family transcriptional regulator n=1 Tax=Nocardiopsis sp. LOL_012 TaxID=3345409 RepID=UPI003A867517
MVRSARSAAAVPAGAGRRERKKAATRTALLEAVLRLVERHGVEEVTVERITTEADIAPRTFFNYFSGKEEAIVAPLEFGAESLIAGFRDRPRTESVLTALRQAVLTVLPDTDLGRERVCALRLIVRAPSLKPQRLAVFSAQERVLSEAVAERVGAVSGDLYPDLCAATALTAMRVVVEGWLDQAEGVGAAPSLAVLHERVEEMFVELAAGLDRPGTE